MPKFARQVLMKNPWSGFQLAGRTTFVLHDDQVAIANYNMGRQNDATYIHLDAPPQPFTGNPDAPIWLLLMNPSYDEVDIFDLVNEARGEQIIRDVVEDITAITRGNFDRRRALMEAQYNFDFEQLADKGYDCPWFYVLDESFHTVRHGGNKKRGGYEWWNRYLLSQSICERVKDNLKKFFVLESFPYHSRNFGAVRNIGPQTLAKSHCAFWEQMIVEALKENKIFLCRGKEIAERVCAIAKRSNLPPDNIFINADRNGRPAQSFNVGYGNFISYKGGRNGDDIIRMAMKQ